MPKTVSIAPSWYWPAGTPRFCGIPPFGVDKLILGRLAREAGEGTALGSDGFTETGAQLCERVGRLEGLIERQAGADGPLVLAGSASPGFVELALAGISSPRWVELEEVAGTAELSISPDEMITAQAGGDVPVPDEPRAATNPERPALGWAGRSPVHSQASLIASAISLSLFYSVLGDAPWVVMLPPQSWAWPAAVLGGLYRMVPVWLAGGVQPGDGPPFSSLPPGPPAVVFGELHSLGQLAREAKRDVKAARGRLAAVIATIDGPFDPGDRKRLEKLLDCPVLTILGSHEAGPVIASHPSWYVAESAGIPITNADVMPVDPRSKEPIQTLWELVEYAQITVRSPMVAPYRREGERVVRAIGNLADLGLLGSSDPNGMIYVVPG